MEDKQKIVTEVPSSVEKKKSRFSKKKKKLKN